MNTRTALAAAALAAMAGGVAPATAQDTIPIIRPSISALGRLPKFFSAGASYGAQSYRCPDCSSLNQQSVTLMGRAGWQVAGGKGLVGAEASVFLNGQERSAFLLASGSVLALSRRLMIGGGFGFGGFRVPILAADFNVRNWTYSGYNTLWGLAADVHVEYMVPLGSGWVVAPRIAYTSSLNAPLPYLLMDGGRVYEGNANVALLQVGTSVTYRGRRPGETGVPTDRSPHPGYRLPQQD